MVNLLSLPNRVSRLYPVFALTFALTSTIFLYAWQSTLLDLNNLSHVAEHEKSLQNQVDTLLADQKLDRARMLTQKQQITDTTTKLVSLQKDLGERTKEITAKEQELQVAKEQLKNQQNQLSSNASELEKLRTRPPLFSFQNESLTATNEQKIADVKELVTSAYDYIEKLYGAPYLLNNIVITFVDKLEIEGSSGEIIIVNSSKGITINIHLKDFDKTSFQDINTVIHEIIHGFHGVAVFESSALEEGMTVAATDAVMQAMMADGKIPRFSHLYLTATESQYTTWNKTLRVHNNNTLLYASPSISQIYQLAGTAWYRLYKQDPAIFKKINAYYYPKVQKGILADNPLVLTAIRESISSVEGQGIDTYLAANKAFNPQ